ncbi:MULTISPECIES: DUF3802 family protein [unclassified Arsukibacterium]|uniref:DUF3802 family protein n=1 Tax=unclassified Arsukibacterium TaxID=2635278 RepID=UPI000C575E0C|nr:MULTISPECIES: DUF3802 family protein [unclassified Arsukibacterium]MAA96018.1 topoisomerase II [Rheinheimera sp.]MBM34313.1 topoisomerase II [Rheinheimera sp.]HAW92299.1 DUF3802 domain-containing protein [Candidatus Azambacteria bacterium]|tara:strand:+ start:653 stop:1003 length:351 start_codon:yes stop_codon:yes gene_type:complete
MVTDQPGYEHLIQFLTEHLALFTEEGTVLANGKAIGVILEERIAEQIITLCTQHTELEINHRSMIIREVDGIMYDFQEVLSSVLEKKATAEQAELINEIALLIKNLFDSAIARLMD